MEVNLVNLNLSTIQQLQGGAVYQLVQKLLAQAVADCENRPAEERARKLNLQLEICPVTRIEEIDETHNRLVLDGVKLRFNMDLKCPTRKTIEFDCGVGENHQLVFNPDSPHNHRQAGLPLTFDGEINIVPMTGTES